MLKKVLFATIFIYYGAAYIPLLWAEDESKTCLGWVCEAVQCPEGYAVWIPEKNGFLPCENFEQYIETQDVGLLR